MVLTPIDIYNNFPWIAKQIHFVKGPTVEFRRLGQCFIDWATAVVGEADRELTCVILTYHSSGPIYETSAQSTKSPGIFLVFHIECLFEQFIIAANWNHYARVKNSLLKS